MMMFRSMEHDANPRCHGMDDGKWTVGGKSTRDEERDKAISSINTKISISCSSISSSPDDVDVPPCYPPSSVSHLDTRDPRNSDGSLDNHITPSSPLILHPRNLSFSSLRGSVRSRCSIR